MARRLLAAGAVSAVAGLLTAGGLATGALDSFQRRGADALFPAAEAHPAIVIVAIDEESIEELGPLPWSREVHAELAERLAASGASVVAWDVVFDASSRDRAANERFARGLASLPAAILAERVSVGPAEGGLLVTTAVSGPQVELAEAAGNVAHAYVTRDPADGVTRRLPLLLRDRDGAIVPSLSIEAYRLHLGAGGSRPVPGGVRVGGVVVPTEGPAALRLNFAEGLRDVHASAVISVLGVLEDRIDPARFRDAVVLIGAAGDRLGDRHRVPIDRARGIPGVLLHANALNTMLARSFVEPASRTQTVFWAALVALLVALAAVSLPPRAAAPMAGIVAILHLAVATIRLRGGVLMDLVYPLLGAVIALLLSLLWIISWSGGDPRERSRPAGGGSRPRAPGRPPGRGGRSHRS